MSSAIKAYAATWRSGPWSMKAYYLCYFVAIAAYAPYVSLYLQTIHLDGAQIGLVTSLAPFVAVALPPIWGWLSDRYGWRKRLINLALVTVALVAPIVPLTHSFGVLFVLMVLLAVALSPAAPLADATTLDWLQHHRGSYGAIRVYGSFGYMISTFVIGNVYVGHGINWLFPLYGAAMFVTFLVSLNVPPQSDRIALAPGTGIGTLARDRRVVLFLAFCALGYGTYAAYNTFFALYLKELGADTHIVGNATALAALSELPVMALAGSLISRFGVKALLLMGLGAACLRWTAYGLLHDYRVAVAIGLLHGFSFAGFYVAGVTYIDRRVPPELRATGQTLFSGATFGVGSVIGTNLFGSLYDHLHANAMFLAAAVLCAAAILALALLIPDVRPATASAEITPDRVDQRGDIPAEPA